MMTFSNLIFHNPAFVWGPTDDLAKLFSVFTPGFMKRVPFGPYVGEVKYWPFFWMMPGVFVYFWLLPLLFNLVIKHSRVELFNDVQKISRQAIELFSKKNKTSDEN